MAGLKIFSGIWHGQRNRAVVCKTKKEAMALLGTTVSEMRHSFGDSDWVRPEDDGSLEHAWCRVRPVHGHEQQS